MKDSGGGCRASFGGMHRQLGFTLIYVTHQREEMEEMAVRIVRLRDGKLEPRE